MDDHVLIVSDPATLDVLVVGPFRCMADALDDVARVEREHPGTVITSAPLVAPRASLIV